MHVVQSQAQEAVVRLRNSMESEWRSKYEQAAEELRVLRQQIRGTRDTTSAENVRLKVHTLFVKGIVLWSGFTLRLICTVYSGYF